MTPIAFAQHAPIGCFDVIDGELAIELEVVRKLAFAIGRVAVPCGANRALGVAHDSVEHDLREHGPMEL